MSLATSPCALNTAVCDGTADRILVLYSLSKQSNMAGYRTAFIAGDAGLVHEMSAYRKQIGQIIPGPVQSAMAAGLRDFAGGAVRVGAGEVGRLLARHGRSGRARHHSEPRGVLRSAGMPALLRHRE